MSDHLKGRRDVATNLPMRPRESRWPLVMCIGTLLFCWPAIWNSAPFVFPDTRAYYTGGHVAIEKLFAVFNRIFAPVAGSASDSGVAETLYQARGVRSAFYSLFVYGLSNVGSLWVVIAVQAALLVWVCRVGFAHVGASWTPKRHLQMLAFLALLTTASWSASMVMPDVFTSILLLALVTLLVYWPDLTTATRLALAVAVVAAVLMHASHLPLAALIGLAALLMERRGAWRSPARWLATATCGAVAVLALLAVSIVGFHQATLFPQSPPILLAESIEAGPARFYLQEHCPQAHFEMCKHLDRLDLSADEFMFSPYGVYSVVSPDEREQIRREDKRITLAAALEYPWLDVTWRGWQFLRQLTTFGLQDFELGSYATIANNGMELTFPAKQSGWLQLRTVVDYTVVILSIGILLLVWRARLLNAAQRRFSFLVVLGVLVNAMICGAISTPQPRYESRVMWLLPFLAIVFTLGQTAALARIFGLRRGG